MKKAYCLLATLASLTAPSTMLTAMAGNTQGAAIVTELQEQNTITGVITDTQGEPITGATVAVVGKTVGAVSDINGRFTLNVRPGAKLSISYVGYKTVTVAASESMKIELQEDAGQLSEVVVVGYGTQKKANLTGAVSTVDLSKTMAGRPQQDVAKALQGAVPGLSVISNNGDINGKPTLRIRGVGTLSNDAKSNPLIVVDGVPMDDISFLNTQDIESVSVLKDAASTSIYGTRAAFGVILIQTKGAKGADRTTINYSNNFSWDGATFLPKFSDVPSQLRAALEGKANANNYEVELFGMYFDKLLPLAEKWQQQNGGKQGYREMRQYVDDNNVGDYTIIDKTPYYYADWDINKIYYNNAAPAQSHALSIQGASGKSTYYLSLGYDYKEGTMKIRPDKLNKYNASLAITTSPYDWLQMGARINFTRRDFTTPDTYNNVYQYIWRWGSFFLPSGSINGHDRRIMAMLKQAADKNVTTDYLRINSFAKANITEGLTLNADFTYAIENMNSGSQDFSVYGLNWGSLTPSYIVNKGSTNVWRDNSKTNTWTLNAYLNYEKTFAASHNLKVMLGLNAEKERYTYFWGNRKNIIDERFPELNLASPIGQDLDAAHTHRASAGYFGRINYDYKDIYLLELNGRYDGSSRFPRHSHWAFFPSVSLGYRFSEEPYFKNLKNVVSNGKLRASFGEIGNEAVGDYMFESLITQVDRDKVHWVDGNQESANKLPMFNTPNLVEPILTWERIRTTDVGLDLGFLNNELSVGFDWYQRENTDMLAPSQVLPQVLGTDAPMANAGTLRTRGWELTLDWHHRFGEFNVYANFNLADSKTVVIKWESKAKLLNQNYSGKTYGDIWGFETDRYFEENDFTGQNADGTWNYANGIASQKGLEQGSFHYGPGDVKFKDLDGNGVIDGGDGTADNHGDLKVIGNFLPRYEYSFHLGGAWRGFDLDLFFQGVGKRHVWTVSSMNFPLMREADLAIYDHQMSYNRVIYKNGLKDVERYEVNQANKYPRLFPGNDPQGTISVIDAGTNNYYPQSRYLTDMSYLRLKNVTLGYTLPKELTRKAYIQKARIYFSANNLFLLYKGNDLPVDPEINAGAGLAYGGWGRTAPITRTFSFGMQVTL
ncbi:TonB-linked outer membrane protein, SusC/RagA family [Prevotella sp. oral taxon 472 str. F0295]|nr:TonB-linked outer membrane protein, SusC/RagA family [Prevotella sp. oral taxon 472 str. F0295]